MFGFTNLYMYLNEDFEPCFHTDFDVRWMINFAIGGAVTEFYRLDDEYSTPVFVDVVTLSEPVSTCRQVVDVVKDYVMAEDED